MVFYGKSFKCTSYKIQYYDLYRIIYLTIITDIIKSFTKLFTKDKVILN